MSNDVLAKAAEAVRQFIRSRFCEACPVSLLSPEGCLSLEARCWLRSLHDPHCASDLARAVLEAAGVAEMAELLGWYKEDLEWKRQDCVTFTYTKSCEACGFNPCDTVAKIERIKAALARAGERDA